jgi:hypothetical protein
MVCGRISEEVFIICYARIKILRFERLETSGMY